jgi:organic radical activating enzyme
MCSPHDSSAWTPEWKKIKLVTKSEAVKGYVDGWMNAFAGEDGNYRWHENENFLNRLYEQVPHIKQLYFAGGEPFLIKEHFAVLEKCIEMGQASHIEVRYNTNLTVLPPRLFELWKHFKSVKVTCSIDAYGERDEYIRHPTEWDTIEKNLNILENCEHLPNLTVTLACCVSLLNVWHFPDFIRWKLRKDYKRINAWPNGAGLVNFHLVYFPPFLNVRVLPASFKAEVTERFNVLINELREDPPFEGFLDHPYGIVRLEGLVKYMNEEDWSNRFDQCLEFIRASDEARGTDIIKALPELKQLFQQ